MFSQVGCNRKPLRSSNYQMKKDKDIRTVKLVLEGKTRAYAYLVNRYKDMVFNITYRILRNSEDAEEAAQDTFVKAYQSLSSFGFRSKFSTWLFRIAYNTAISRTRKFSPELSELNEQLLNARDDEDFSLQMDVPDEEMQRTLLEKALAKMDAEDNSLVSMYYTDDLSVAEISQITGLSESNVKVRLFRLRNRLREIIFSNTQTLTMN